jgi:alpha-1,3-rhamnosyl/mannosyltransferase
VRVGFDGRALMSPAAGVRRYARELLLALVELGEPLELVALGGVRSSVPSGVRHVPAPPHPPTNLGWTQVGLPRVARDARVDVLHAPAYTAPLWGRVPVVLTIHDVSYARRPEWYPYRRDLLRRAFYRRSALRASAIVTDSTFSAAEIHAAYGVPLNRLTVVPLGAAPKFSVPSDEPLALPTGVAGPFVLHVGDLHARRNLGVALSAVLRLRERSPAHAALSLVLAGVDRGAGDELARAAVEAGSPGAVVRLGRVSETGLLSLYRAASALVYPSRYEGFGLPVVEAMACGTPVVASRAASMPEVLGEAGVLADPDDVAPWTAALSRILEDVAWRDQLRAVGRARAALFTWQRTAELTYEVYRRVAGG